MSSASSKPITDVDLTRYAWLSIAAAVITISMKLLAYWLTNSVSLLSDALESLVNLISAIVALFALTIAARPADDEFAYGYTKAEFFSSGFEGGMILLAAGSIIYAALPRILHPQPLEQVGLGLTVSVAASAINFGVARVLAGAGKRHNSITLEADANHLMTDVITTGGVLVGVALVSVTGWLRLDPLVAMLVGANIIYTGIRLLRRSAAGLMDQSLPAEDMLKVQQVLDGYTPQGVRFHALRSRSAGARRFVSMHILTPGDWTVQSAHNMAEKVEGDVRVGPPNTVVFTHIEPLEDARALNDTTLDRTD